MDTKQEQNTISDDKSLFSIIDVFSLRLVKQHFQAQIQEIEKQHNVEININEDYGQVQISKKAGEKKDQEEDQRLFSEVGYKIIELTTIQSNKLKDGKFDCNGDFFQKIQKRLKREYEGQKRNLDYNIEFLSNDLDGNSISQYSYRPLVLKTFNIKGKFVVKICKIEQPEFLSFDKIDVLVLNITNSGIFLDEFGYMLAKSNKEINALIKSLKGTIKQSKFIDEKVFNFGNKNVSLIIQLEDDEESCIKNLKNILKMVDVQKFSQKGNLKINIGWRSCCNTKYFTELYKFLESYETKKTYLQFPTEICLITDEGLENQLIQIAQSVQFNQTVKGKVETKTEIVWNINNVKYPRYVDQATILPGIPLNKEITELIDTAVRLQIEQFYVAMKVEGKETDYFQNSKQLGLSPDLVDRLKLNLKTLKETNLSQSYTNQIINQCDFYYYLHPFDEDFVQYQEDVQKVIRSYIQLGVTELRLEKDSATQEVITPIFLINTKTFTMTQCSGKKNIVYMKRQEKKIQVINTEQQQALDEMMKMNVADFLKSDQADKVCNLVQKSKPLIQVRARPDTFEQIVSFINKLKDQYFITHSIKCSKNISTTTKQCIEDLNLKENIEITFVDDIALIYGFKKSLNRLLPTIMNYICENKLAEESVYHIPSFWDGQQNNLKLVPLDITSEEAVRCIQLFSQSLSNQIIKIQRIQNINLWKNYQFEKETLISKGCATEKLLFHGPGVTVNPETIYSAVEEGFDFRNNDAGQYGRGAHFNEEASLASIQAYKGKSSNIILIASVLVGKFFQSEDNQKHTKPPVIPNSADLRYDSVRSNKKDGNNTYVVFHNSKAYPYYIIEYKP